jgi:hypothetical protein
MFPFSRRHDLLILLLLLTCFQLCDAQSRATPRGVFRTGWGDDMARAQKFVDRDRAFTRAQILQMGYTRLANEWRGGYRDVPVIYVEVVGHDNKLRLRKLSVQQRRQIERLRHAIDALDENIVAVCRDGGEEGTALLMDSLDLDATREEFIHHLLTDKRTKLSKTEVRSRMQNQMQRLQGLVGKYWHWVSNPDHNWSDRRVTRHAANHRHIQQAIVRVNRTVVNMPPDRLLKTAKLLDSRITTLKDLGF